MQGPTGKRTYFLPILLAIGLSLYLVGGTGNLEGGRNQTPNTQAFPHPNSGSSAFAGSAQKKQLEIGTFDFITATPAPVPVNNDTNGTSFLVTSTDAGNAVIYTDEQNDLISKGFVQSSDTVAGIQAVKLTGTLPYGDINGKHILAPTQATFFYVVHASKIYRIAFEYLGTDKDPLKESQLTAMLSTASFQ